MIENKTAKAGRDLNEALVRLSKSSAMTSSSIQKSLKLMSKYCGVNELTIDKHVEKLDSEYPYSYDEILDIKKSLNLSDEQTKNVIVLANKGSFDLNQIKIALSGFK